MNEISDAIVWPVAEIRLKMNGLRAQLGSEIAVGTEMKSGQGTDECYKSSWVF